jgi:hypothetical protein
MFIGVKHPHPAGPDPAKTRHKNCSNHPVVAAEKLRHRPRRDPFAIVVLVLLTTGTPMKDTTGS